MGSLKLTTASSGSVILSPANTASDTTITVPAVTGTMDIQGPAFSAWQSASQTLSNNAYNKITLTSEFFDTNSNYDTSTSKFTPTVAGYYYVTGIATANTSSTSDQLGAYIYKNGSNYIQGTSTTGLSNFFPTASVNGLIYMNGSTDYLELYIYLGSSATKASVNNAQSTVFSASLVRAA